MTKPHARPRANTRLCTHWNAWIDIFKYNYVLILDYVRHIYVVYSCLSMRCKASVNPQLHSSNVSRSRGKSFQRDRPGLWIQYLAARIPVDVPSCLVPAAFCSKNDGSLQKVIFKICKFLRRSLSFGCFCGGFQATNGLRQFPELDGPSNRQLVGSQVQLFRANFYTSPWRW